jgi:GH25 family lysozyme M1 (1,4-beta-N-acetylmuramidase)
VRAYLFLGFVAACSGPTTAAVEQADLACAAGVTVKGMDVSYYETSVDWNAAHAAGIDFAIIRVTDGTQYIDPKFPEYWAGAREAGVIRSAYQFFRPAEDPIAQADLLLSRMGPLQPGDLPPVIDVEVNGGLSTDQVATAVRAWVAHVQAAIGRPPIIYAGLYSWHDLTASADMTGSPLWVAQYTSAPCPDIPVPWTKWLMWQYTATGSIDGVPGMTLDLDQFNGTLDDLRGFTVGGTCGDGVCSGDETVATCPMDCQPCGVIPADGGIVDDGDACFSGGGPDQYLRKVTTAGEGGDLIWTHATAAAAQVSFGQWDLFLAEAGRYKVEVYTDHAYATSTQAAYGVQANGALAMVTIDQSAIDGWQSLGDFDFAQGGGQWVHLADNTGESATLDAQLVFDAVRLTRLDAPVPPDHSGGGCAAGGGGWLAALVIACGLAGTRRSRRAPR